MKTDIGVEEARRQQGEAHKVLKAARRAENLLKCTERLTKPTTPQERRAFLAACGPEACADQKRGYHGSRDGSCSYADDLVCRLIHELEEGE